MTYAWFLAIFLVPAIVGLAACARPSWARAHSAATGIVCALAFAYTAPWDNHAASIGLWTFSPQFAPPSHFILHLPWEEYAFYILQSLLICFAIVACSRSKRLWGSDGA